MKKLTNKILKDYKPDSPIKLNSAQKKLASSYNKLGLPKAVAAVMAKQDNGSSGGSVPGSLAGISGSNSMASQLGLSNIKRPRKMMRGLFNSVSKIRH